MPLRVTFDTNVLDLACRPERFPKDPRQPQLQNVKNALAAGTIQGFYSVTMLTIEGIMRKDRAEVFASTQAQVQPVTLSMIKNANLPEEIRAKVGNADVDTIGVNIIVEQPARKPLHPEVCARIKSAYDQGVRVLKGVPRVGAFLITDPEREFYLDNGEGAALQDWLNKTHEVSRAIQDRGLGFAQIEALGQSMAARDPAKAWFEVLDDAKDIHEKRAVERAFSEWADGDAIATHVAYGLDVFCSADVGNSNATNSVLDQNNRAWLTTTYGINFMSFDDLLNNISQSI